MRGAEHSRCWNFGGEKRPEIPNRLNSICGNRKSELHYICWSFILTGKFWHKQERVVCWRCWRMYEIRAALSGEISVLMRSVFLETTPVENVHSCSSWLTAESRSGLTIIHYSCPNTTVLLKLQLYLLMSIRDAESIVDRMFYKVVMLKLQAVDTWVSSRIGRRGRQEMQDFPMAIPLSNVYYFG